MPRNNEEELNPVFRLNNDTGRWELQPLSPVEYEIQIDSEGEQVPEVPEVNPEPEILSVPVPTIAGLYFQSETGGRTLRNTRSTDAIVPGCSVQVGVWDRQPDAIRQSYSQFKQWAVENGFGVSSTAHDYFTENGYQINVDYYFLLCDINDPNAIDIAGIISQPDCSCGEELDYPTVMCPSCDAKNHCASCRKFSTNVLFDPSWGDYCDECGINCEECGSACHSQNGDCITCNPRQNCNSCGVTMYENRDHVNEWAFEEVTRYFCDPCFPGLCHSCGTVYDVEQIIIDGDVQQCISCVSKNSFEEWDENSQDRNMLIPTIPGRETIRLVGVEIEGANGENVSGFDGGHALARGLYQEGLTRYSEMTGYHSGSGSRSYRVHVERDSSVDWEMVIGPLNVADEEDVRLLNKSVRVVRGFINNKTLKLDMRAGLHIHVGADRVPFPKAYNLHKLYMYTEDFLYRLGAAKWPYHRSINRRGGRDQAGKSPVAEGKLNFAQTFSGQRYYGLSFDNYFARYFEHCGCGARTYGLFDECTCDLGKCTFEFRLFNTTANTIKLHAYLAICQALVAKAIEMDEITDSSLFPALDFTKTRASDLHPSTRRKLGREWEKRIVFVNEELPLTTEEKASIHYCIMNSEMGKIVTNADILLQTEEN